MIIVIMITIVITILILIFMKYNSYLAVTII
jgi:hypothetical protein